MLHSILARLISASHLANCKTEYFVNLFQSDVLHDHVGSVRLVNRSLELITVIRKKSFKAQLFAFTGKLRFQLSDNESIEIYLGH